MKNLLCTLSTWTEFQREDILSMKNFLHVLNNNSMTAFSALMLLIQWQERHPTSKT